MKPLFKNTDVREKREIRRKYLEKLLQVFKQENLQSGTRALREYLKAMTVPRKCISELSPEEFECLSETEMQRTISRVQTLSTKALEAKKDKDSLKKKPVKTSTCGELVGQPTDSSAPEVETEHDLGDSDDEQSEESSLKKSATTPDHDEGLGSPSRTSCSSGTPRRSRSPTHEKERKLRSTVAKVVGKKLPRNPYSESRRYSSTSTSERTSASSSRSRHREDSPKRSFRNPSSRDNRSSRRGEERKRSSRSHGRR